MKVGDLVRETWGLERVGVVVSKIRRSTPQDNYELGVMYGDNHRVVDIITSDTGKKEVADLEALEVISESR